MSSPERPKVGTIAWRDLTVPNAEQVRDFYKGVVGWDSSPQDMGGYDDFNMNLNHGLANESSSRCFSSSRLKST